MLVSKRRKFTIFSSLLLNALILHAQVNVQNNGTLFISTPSDTLFINGTFTNSAAASLTNNANIMVKQDIVNDQPSLTAGTGTLYLNGSVSQNVGGSQRLNTNNFTIDNTAGVTLSNDMSIKHTFTLNNGNFALNTNNVTLLSDINNTANVAPLGATGSITYGTGKFIIERFILARRSWRLLTAPVITTQTINDAWQEGQVGTNTLPGYGTHITGGSVLNGFDQGVNLNPGMQEYIGGAWKGIPNTNSTVVTNRPGYMLFVRGDRSVDLSQGIYAVPTTTILRTSGQLKTGDQSFPVVATGFTVVGNPYASPIDFHQLTRTNVQDNFYQWDPKLAGPSGVGGFVNISWNGSSYDITPSSGGSNLNQFVQSGSAFLVRSLNGSSGGTLVVKESDKSATQSINANRSASAPPAILKTNLYSQNADGSSYIIDGILNSYADIYSDTLDKYDAVKLDNLFENLSSERNGEFLVAERRHAITSADTIFLDMRRMKAKSYQFELIADNFTGSGLIGFFEDSYLNTSTPIDLQDTTIFNFTVINVPGSWNPKRFRIVFKQATVLPLALSSARAFALNNIIKVEWRVENEVNVNRYEVEKSADGQQFIKASAIMPKANNNGTPGYSWIDENAFEGHNYYRIKIAGIDGEATYSTVMKVYMGKSREGISLTTNLITGKSIPLQMNNVPGGVYTITVTNNLGQRVYTKKINHEDGQGTENIRLNKNFIPGIYHLNIIKPDFTNVVIEVLIQ